MSDLIENIYYEAQVSRLCAMHALNMLMQSAVFDSDALTAIAKQLDEAEKNIMSSIDKKKKSHNYSSSGYYSLQVIENALLRHNLIIESIGSMNIDDYAKGTAYICNKDEHWFTIRRFKHNDRWFVLNSMLSHPVPISNDELNGYIATLIGNRYSVFSVIGELPNCVADLIEFDQPPSTLPSLIFGDDRDASQSSPPLIFGGDRESSPPLILDQGASSIKAGTSESYDDRLFQQVLEISRQEMEQRENDEMYEQARLMSLHESGPSTSARKPLTIAKWDSDSEDDTRIDTTAASGQTKPAAVNSGEATTEPSGVVPTSSEQPSHSPIDAAELRRKRAKYIEYVESLGEKKTC